MSLQEIRELLLSNSGFWFCALFIALSLVEIAPVKINPWSWLGQRISKAFNGEVMKEIADIKHEVKDVKQEVKDVKEDILSVREEAKEREATNRRARILRFGDEVTHGTKYSKEHFDQTMLDITEYENYCNEHPNYMNNVAKATIKYIKNVYQKCLEEDGFL